MNFTPLCEGFGLETSDVDVSHRMSAAKFKQVEQAFFAGQVLVLRGQKVSAEQYVAFARRFGVPEPHVIDQFHHPDDPNILILSNVKVGGKPSGLADAGSYFHTDYSYLQVPARATMLFSIEVPQVGGNTLFANQYAAYDDLPAAMKRKIDPLVAVHHYGNRKVAEGAARTAVSTLTDDQKARMPLITHPVVRPHPVTGQKALYAVSGSSYGIVGMPDDEAVALLDELAVHATQPKYQLAFLYGLGDLVIWDNASLLHSATLVDLRHARTLWRITVKEPAPAGHAEAVLAPTFVPRGM